ncbi:MAG TPA: Zn-dependent alcohol dehydrogenase [Vicinamibacteria bacterium]|nr:Zn-dependent alcohol dehydrogenase [Vicinamibacteria bacterium]
MQAAICFETGRPPRVEEVELEGPRAGEVQVRVAAAGVCHSDWSVITGAMPARLPCVIGHEGAGTVEETGAGVEHVRPGDRVVLSWVTQCGQCFYCRAGEPHLCAVGARVNQHFRMPDGSTRLRQGGTELQAFSALGAMAERVVAPARAVVRLDEPIPLRTAALVGCAVTTGVGAVLNTAAVRPGSTVAVFGVGGVGLNVLQGAVLAGAERIVAVDMSAARLALARTFGATDVLDAAATDVPARIRDLTGGRGADYAFDAAGRKASIETAYESVRRGGTCVVIGIGARGEEVSLNAYLLPVMGKRLLGCWYGSADVHRDVPRLLALHRQGRLKLDELVGRTYALAEVGQAFADLESGRAGRGLVVMEDA